MLILRQTALWRPEQARISSPPPAHLTRTVPICAFSSLLSLRNRRISSSTALFQQTAQSQSLLCGEVSRNRGWTIGGGKTNAVKNEYCDCLPTQTPSKCHLGCCFESALVHHSCGPSCSWVSPRSHDVVCIGREPNRTQPTQPHGLTFGFGHAIFDKLF